MERDLTKKSLTKGGNNIGEVIIGRDLKLALLYDETRKRSIKNESMYTTFYRHTKVLGVSF